MGNYAETFYVNIDRNFVWTFLTTIYLLETEIWDPFKNALTLKREVLQPIIFIIFLIFVSCFITSSMAHIVVQIWQKNFICFEETIMFLLWYNWNIKYIIFSNHSFLVFVVLLPVVVQVVTLSIPPVFLSLAADELRPPSLACWRRRKEWSTYLRQLFFSSSTLRSSAEM